MFLASPMGAALAPQDGNGPGGEGDGAPPPGVTCSGFTHLDGVGPVCPVDGGLWEVFASDGTSLGYTHGPDPAPEEPPADGAGTDGSSPVQPAMCTPNPATDYHSVVIYARARDDSDRYATVVDDLRDEVTRANTHLRVEAGHFNVQADYKMRCVGGVVQIVNAVLPTLRDQASFSTIVFDLRNQGHDNHRVKYWVYYDDTSACSCAGIGSLYSDDRPGAENYNNGHPAAQPMFAVTFGRLDHTIMMHENGHNMGAVQLSSPHNTGAFHCIDGNDIMCYNDGGPRGNQYSSNVCRDRKHFDCNHDDYFHPRPGSGTYLATHWNIGSPVNRFLVFGDCGLAREGSLLAPGAGLLSWEGLVSRTETGIDPTCAGRAFVLTTDSPFADFDVCFYDGDVELACHLTGGPEEGTIPAGTDTAEIRMWSGAAAQYTLITP